MHYALVLLALGALLALHELGHLVAARLLGVRVPRFVFGFGPPMASFRLGGTQFVVGAVPLGATVHIQGMNPHRADAAEAVSFRAMGPLRRALIILAGPLANYVFALGVLFALYTSGTHVVVPLTVGTVRPGSEAARAQLLPGDRIDTVDGQQLRTWTEFVEKVAVGVGRTLELRVDRHGESRTVSVRPRADERGEGRIGVSQQYVYRSHAPGEALRHAFVHTRNLASEGVTMFVRLVRGGQPHGGPTGPGALVRQESSDAASSGVDSVLRALVAASMALALLTLLPVPGLDGGRVLLLLIEVASGRKLPPRVETVAQTVGFLAISAVIVGVAAAEIRGALPERFKWGTQAATTTTPGTPPAPGAGTPTAAGSTPTPTAPGGTVTPGVAGTPGTSAPAVTGAPGTSVPGVAGAVAPGAPGTTTPGVAGTTAPGASGADGTTAPVGTGAPGTTVPAVVGPGGAVAPGSAGTTGTGTPGVAGASEPVPSAVTGAGGAVAPAVSGTSGSVAPSATGAVGPMPATTAPSATGTAGPASPTVTAPGGPSAPATSGPGVPGTAVPAGPGAAAPGASSTGGKDVPSTATPNGASEPTTVPAASTAADTKAPAPAPGPPSGAGGPSAPTPPGAGGPTPPTSPSPSAPPSTSTGGASAPTSA
ncbi:site-2 protease family protein [Corallococcus terminator]